MSAYLLSRTVPAVGSTRWCAEGNRPTGVRVGLVLIQEAVGAHLAPGGTASPHPRRVISVRRSFTGDERTTATPGARAPSRMPVSAPGRRVLAGPSPLAVLHDTVRVL